MCLLTTETKPQIASEDIIVYKLLKVKDKTLVSPWKNYFFEVNKLYEDEELQKDEHYKEFTFIGSGFFHSYKNTDLAKNEITRSRRFGEAKTEFRIYKAIIPKDTQFYTGVYKDYCSKFIKILDEYV